jgi:hypothetical protein
VGEGFFLFCFLLVWHLQELKDNLDEAEATRRVLGSPTFWLCHFVSAIPKICYGKSYAKGCKD